MHSGSAEFYNIKQIISHKTSVSVKLWDNCILFENFTASIADLMVANGVIVKFCWATMHIYIIPMSSDTAYFKTAQSK
jgi:hypothetical protein